MGALAPIIFRILSRKEGHSSDTQIESSLFSKLVCYQVVQTVFVAAVSGSLFGALNDITNDPTSTPEFLGRSIPEQSSFIGWANDCIGIEPKKRTPKRKAIQ